IAKGGSIAIADYTIVNDGSLEDLHRSIDNILKKLDE
ncbi:MAG: dephospho-CoA kinase, partial [Candidatus Komeilibacteria bacterium CG10_big_fil_rev_8_21_14_0_10_41_13]